MKEIRHIGWKVERCRYGLLERIFAEKWQHENGPHGIGQGGILQALFLRQDPDGYHRLRRPRLVINRRDALVAATVVQWLGTNVGYGFLTECLRRAGLRIVDIEGKELDDRYYSAPCSGDEWGYEVIPGAWNNLARRWAWTPGPEVAEMRRPLRYVESDERRRKRLGDAVRWQHEQRRREAQMERWRQSVNVGA